MRFPMPHYPCEFEIPDDWLSEAGVIGFTPMTASYRSTAGILVPLTAIEPAAAGEVRLTAAEIDVIDNAFPPGPPPASLPML